MSFSHFKIFHVQVSLSPSFWLTNVLQSSNKQFCQVLVHFFCTFTFQQFHLLIVPKHIGSLDTHQFYLLNVSSNAKILVMLNKNVFTHLATASGDSLLFSYLFFV